MIFIKSILATVILSISLYASNASKSHPITTLITANMFRTPVTLEIAEYLFDESPTLYWDYIDKIYNLETPLYQIGMLLLLLCIFYINMKKY